LIGAGLTLELLLLFWVVLGTHFFDLLEDLIACHHIYSGLLGFLNEPGEEILLAGVLLSGG